MSDPELVCYVPFDEADGKHFTERVHSARGYFHPQEPYVNADNELVFTGYQCMALPSFRAKFETDTTYTTDTKETDGLYLSEDGAFYGGILWDHRLLWQAGNAEYSDTMNVLKGVAQLRIRLRQLKEGIICGRFGIRWNVDTEEYNLFVVRDGSSNPRTWTGGTVDETWIGTEKTITIFFDGTQADLADAYKMYVDDTEVSLTAAADTTWNNDTAIVDDSTYRAFTDTTSTTVESCDGAIGGNITVPEYCVAFDLIFFRQWWDDHQYEDEDTFVANTWDLEELPDELRYMYKGLTCSMNSDQTDALSFLNLGDWTVSKFTNRGYVTIPITTNIQNAVTYMQKFGSSYVMKADTLVKRIVEWESGGNDAIILTTGYYNMTDAIANGYLGITGCSISNLVNEYNYKTFRDGQRIRPVFTEAITNVASVQEFQEKIMSLFDVIEDDSPLQGTEDLGGATYSKKTRYLILCQGDREKTIQGQRSLKMRWCDGPIAYAYDDTFPAIRGIFRYRSEDGNLNKLFMVAGNIVYELDSSTGDITTQKWGWIEGTEMLRSILVNNRLMLMDPSWGALKVNFKGNWSRVGIERPVDIRFRTAAGTETDGSFDIDGQYAWIAQYYDSENGSYSGTIPIYPTQGQMIIVGDTTVTEPTVVHLDFGSCRDYNVDGYRMYRTRNMKTAGVDEKYLFLVCDGRNANHYDGAIVSDIQTDDQLQENDFLPAIYYGQSMIPKPCPAVCSAFNRVWLGGNEDDDAFLRYSEVDALGFASVDEHPETNALVVEEGGTSAITAVIEYATSLFVFKDNAIFRVTYDADGLFSQELIYKGVGAVNQNCVLVAAGSIYFMDSNGIFSYAGGGEPVMVSSGILAFFKNEVNRDILGDHAFMVYSKEDESLLAFVPSSNMSSGCDVCIIMNMRTQSITFDLIPPCTSGFVDSEDGTIYLGSKYGAVLEYTPTTHVDQVSATIATTGTVESDGSVTSVAATLPITGRLEGTFAFAVDTTNYSVWRGVISANTASTLTVEGWETIFNASGDPLGDMSIYIGHLLLYDKTPYLAMAQEELIYDRNLREIEWFANDFSNAVIFYTKTTFNDGTKTSVTDLSSTTIRGKTDIINGAHKYFQTEICALVAADFRVRNTTYMISFTKGREYDG